MLDLKDRLAAYNLDSSLGILQVHHSFCSIFIGLLQINDSVYFLSHSMPGMKSEIVDMHRYSLEIKFFLSVVNLVYDYCMNLPFSFFSLTNSQIICKVA